MGQGAKEQTVTADAYVAALDVPGAKRLLPSAWRVYPQFENIHKLVGVKVITVQMRFNGWVTEVNDQAKRRATGPDRASAAGINNLLYSGDADYSCFADLALVSPEEYFKPNEGSLLQVVITPADKYFPMTNEQIVAEMLAQTQKLFPSARELDMTWSSVVKINESLYR